MIWLLLLCQVELPDATIEPGAARTFTVKGRGDAIVLRAYLALGAESGGAAAMHVTVNGTALTECDLPKTWTMPNHKQHPGPFPMYDGAWTVFFDSDPVPAAKESQYYSPEIREYVYRFSVKLRDGENTVEVRNANGQAPLRLLSSKTHGEEIAPIPDDRLLPARKKWPRPAVAEAKERFLALHRWYEKLYNGDGTWGKGYSDWPLNKHDVTHPLTRFTGYCVLAYLIAGEPDFRKRADEGLAHLLKEQDESGAYRWYWTQDGVLGGDALYETGIAGRALVAGWEATKERKYLDASSKAAAWEIAAPVSPNANYNMFAIWHLAAHYRATKDAKVLDAAVRRTLATLKGQTQTGVWSDAHNQKMGYHGIILRGLVELAAVLPPDHADRAAVLKAATRAANHVVRQQLESGALRLQPSREAPYHGSLAAYAMIEGERLLQWDVADAVSGLDAAPLDHDPSKADTPKSAFDDAILWAAAAWRRAR